jgi:hypothetical protein
VTCSTRFGSPTCSCAGLRLKLSGASRRRPRNAQPFTRARRSLFCPTEAPGLYDTHGEEFDRLYLKYEAEGKARKTILARDLWFQILESQIETGTPYLLYKVPLLPTLRAHAPTPTHLSHTPLYITTHTSLYTSVYITIHTSLYTSLNSSLYTPL